MSRRSDSASEGQRPGHSQSLVSRLGRFSGSLNSLSREGKISAAYEFINHQVNSLSVQKMIDGVSVADTAQTYELRTEKLYGSYLFHNLPAGVSIKVDEKTAVVELLVDGERYSPKK